MYQISASEAAELLASYDADSYDVSDIAHEVADGSEFVIYPARALELIAAVDADELADADAWLTEIVAVTSATTFLRHASLVAYAIVYARTLAALEAAAATV